MSRDNPFPRSAVAEHESQISFNYPAAAQLQLRQSVVDFASDFASPREKHLGRAIGIRGALGSGKTHAIIQAEKAFASQLPSGKSIYAGRLPSTGTLAMYRNFFAPGLELRELQNTYSQHMLRLLRRSLQQNPASESLTHGLEIEVPQDDSRPDRTSTSVEHVRNGSVKHRMGPGRTLWWDGGGSCSCKSLELPERMPLKDYMYVNTHLCGRAVTAA